MVQGVEKLSDVDLQDPPAPHLHQPVPEDVQRLVRRTARPEPERAVQKVLFVDGFQDHDDRALEDLVLERGDARSALPRPPNCLRDPSPSPIRTIPSAVNASRSSACAGGSTPISSSVSPTDDTPPSR